MSPKIIDGDIFKNRRELAVDDYKDLIVDGGVDKVKTLLCEKWKHNSEEIIAVPSLTINNAGRLSGAKWYIMGKITKDINILLNPRHNMNSQSSFGINPICPFLIHLGSIPFMVFGINPIHPFLIHLGLIPFMLFWDIWDRSQYYFFLYIWDQS